MTPYIVKLSNGEYVNLSTICGTEYRTKSVSEPCLTLYYPGTDNEFNVKGDDISKVRAALDKLDSIVSESEI